jgi:hypothetical protein
VVTGSEIGLYVQRRVIVHTESRQTPDFGAFELDNRGELVVPTRPMEVSPSPAPVIAPSPVAPSPVVRSAWDAVYERTMLPARPRSPVGQAEATMQPSAAPAAAPSAAPVPWTSRLKEHAKVGAKGFVAFALAGAAIAAVISSFDGITPLMAFGTTTLAVVALVKGRVLESPRVLRSFTEAILGNKLRRAVSISAVLLGFLVGVRQRSLRAQQENQAQAVQATPNPDAERAAREADRTAERARAFNAAVAEAEQQPATAEGAAAAVYSYRCASHFGVLDAAHTGRFAQRLRTIALALLADRNYTSAISLLEEAKHASPAIDVDADLKRARAAQDKPPNRPPMTIAGKTSATSSPVTPPSEAEMVMVPDLKAGGFQLKCRPKRKTE